jgi:hypothetical protein
MPIMPKPIRMRAASPAILSKLLAIWYKKKVDSSARFFYSNVRMKLQVMAALGNPV